MRSHSVVPREGTTLCVQDVMCRRPTVICADDTVATVLARADQELGHHLVVVQEHEFLGLVAICELKRMPPEATVGQFARSPLFTLEENDPVSLPLRIMRASISGCMLVTDEQRRLTGILTRTDLIAARALRGTRGVDRCMTCQSADHLVVAAVGEPALCCDCVGAGRDGLGPRRRRSSSTLSPAPAHVIDDPKSRNEK